MRTRVLVVEDDRFLSDCLVEILHWAGLDVVGPAASSASALELIDREGCDTAVLDINLGNATSEPVAARLSKLGTPFLTVSGSSKDQRPPAYNGAPALLKPYNAKELVAELNCSIGGSGKGLAA
jgi:DNA-binding response OmpR family regulator